MDLFSYLEGRLGEAIGMGFPGILVPLVLRKWRLPAYLGGAAGFAAIPAIGVYTGNVVGGPIDHAIFLGLAALIGLILGVGLHHGYRHNKDAPKPPTPRRGGWR